MVEERAGAGVFRNILAKLIDALAAVSMTVLVLQVLTGSSLLMLIQRFQDWDGSIYAMNMILQFSFYMYTKSQTLVDAMAGIQVVREDQRLSWPSAAFLRTVISSLMFNPRWPPASL
ncbi:MAG: hypothetical protein BWY85_00548 [Firmicutes bacterium ADurb.Bin506]|jgi:hypothetical protein|nr:MAG: hypothetical protein BWY85_00548 [Firmicutes bacterium ADurb.Bin506]